MIKKYADDLFARLNSYLDDLLPEGSEDADAGTGGDLNISLAYLEGGKIEIRLDDFFESPTTPMKRDPIQESYTAPGSEARLVEGGDTAKVIDVGVGDDLKMSLAYLEGAEDEIRLDDTIDGPTVDIPLDQFPGHIYQPDTASDAEAPLDSKGLTFVQAGDLFL